MHNSEAANPSMQVSRIGNETCALMLSLAKRGTVHTIGMIYLTKNNENLAIQRACWTIRSIWLLSFNVT